MQTSTAPMPGLLIALEVVPLAITIDVHASRKNLLDRIIPSQLHLVPLLRRSLPGSDAIKRANLDGTDIETLISEGAGRCPEALPSYRPRGEILLDGISEWHNPSREFRWIGHRAITSGLANPAGIALDTQNAKSIGRKTRFFDLLNGSLFHKTGQPRRFPMPKSFSLLRT